MRSVRRKHVRKKRVAKSTRSAQALLELTAIVDNAAVGILFTRGRRIQRCNARAAEIFGYPKPSNLLRKHGIIIYPNVDSYERFGREADPLLRVGKSFTAEWSFCKADGSPVWCRVYGKAIDPRRTDGGTVWIVEDITAEKRTQEAERKAMRETEAIMVGAPVAIVFSRERRITRYNRKFAQVFGFEGDAALGVPARVLCRSDEEFDALSRLVKPSLARGEPVHTELFMRHQSGRDMWISVIGYVRDIEHPDDGTIWILQDHTESKRAEEALKRTRDQLTAIVDNAAVGILFSRDGLIQHCNHRVAEIGAYAVEDLIGKPASILYPDADSYHAMGRIAGPLLVAGQSFQGDVWYRRSDGDLVCCRTYARAVDPRSPEQGTVWVIEDVTAAKQAEEALRQAHAVLETTFEHMDQGISIFDADLKCLAFNRRFRELFNLPERMHRPGWLFEDGIRYMAEHGEYGPGDVDAMVQARIDVARLSEPHQFERERPDGAIMEVRGNPVPGGGFVTVYSDVTQRARAERAVRESEARFRSLTELSSDWFWEQDADLRFTRLEGRYITATGKSMETELGMTSRELGFEVDGGWEAHLEVLAAHKPYRDVVMRRVFADGSLHYIRVSGEPVFDVRDRFVGYRGVGSDITPQKRAEERIQYLATHDELTQLPNRVLFGQLLSLTLETARRLKRKFAVLFVDLDRFKIINDSLGHDAGDALLVEIAGVLSQCLRASDVVARLGGDEFVVLVEVGEAQQAAELARKILFAVAKPLTIAGQECHVTASVGIAMYPADAEDEQGLMKKADIAMYVAKEQGKNAYQFYSRAIKTQSLERLTFEVNLRHALERNELYLDYQPKLDLKTGVITGVEALLRWQHLYLELVPPSQFIPLAEETSLMIPIGKWVLKAACAQAVAWRQLGLPPMRMAVNLSPRQFADEDLLRDIAAALADTHMDPALLEFEITESMVMHDPEHAVELLRAIKRMGVRLAIDDFGTGYSSLGHIKRFPIDTLKIDRTFVREIPQRAEDCAIAQAIIAMGKALSLTVVAEGVETREQQIFLREHNCDEMQGYYFSKPVSPIEFSELVRRHAMTMPN